MHIVLSGYFGFDNVGDEAILFAMVQALREAEPGVRLTVLSNAPEKTATLYGVEAVNRWQLGAVSAVLKSCDGFISGGGSLLQDATSMKTIPYYAGLMQLAKRYGKPVFVYAQGMGPIERGLSKWLTKQTLNKVDAITVRDEESRALLERIGVRKAVTVVPDPVIGLGRLSFASAWLEDWLRGAGAERPFVSVSVRDWPTSIGYKEKIAACLDALASDGYAILFVPMHGEHDEKSSQSVAALMKAGAVVAPGNLSIEEKIAIFGRSELLIGMRLHSLIFAAIEQTPFIALSYDPKIDAFAQIAGQPVAGHVEQNNWDGASLLAVSREMLAAREEHVERLQTIVEPLQEQAFVTAQQAIALFQK